MGTDNEKLLLLIGKEFEVDENTKHLMAGDKYSYFVDSSTNKCYRPQEGTILTLTEAEFKDEFIEITTLKDGIHYASSEAIEALDIK